MGWAGGHDGVTMGVETCPSLLTYASPLCPVTAAISDVTHSTAGRKAILLGSAFNAGKYPQNVRGNLELEFLLGTFYVLP